MWSSDEPLALEPANGGTRGNDRYTQAVHRLHRREVVLPLGRQVVNEIRSRHGSFISRNHMGKVTLFVVLIK